MSLLLVCLCCAPKTSYSFSPSPLHSTFISIRRNNHPLETTAWLGRKEAGEGTPLDNVLEATIVESTRSINSTIECGSRTIDQDPSTLLETKYRKRPKMNLSWCERDNCHENLLRERVVGLHNEIMFDHPATGQVAYHWSHEEEETVKPTPCVLLLVKKNDEGLMKVAADVSSSFIIL